MTFITNWGKINSHDAELTTLGQQARTCEVSCSLFCLFLHLSWSCDEQSELCSTAGTEINVPNKITVLSLRNGRILVLRDLVAGDEALSIEMRCISSTISSDKSSFASNTHPDAYTLCVRTTRTRTSGTRTQLVRCSSIDPNDADQLYNYRSNDSKLLCAQNYVIKIAWSKLRAQNRIKLRQPSCYPVFQRAIFF